jgi:TorA maturation chaperone TorD
MAARPADGDTGSAGKFFKSGRARPGIRWELARVARGLQVPCIMQAPADEAGYPAAASAQPVAAEEFARAQLYGLLGALLLGPPSPQLIRLLAEADTLQSPDQAGPLETAWEEVVLAARIMDADAIRDEYDSLFIATGTPLLNPHASLYLSGFMMDHPLASLREDLRALGMARQPASVELEDHLGALCETMALLIAQDRSLAEQRRFFERHIASWAGACTGDMRQAEGANFYRLIASLIDAYLAVESEAFAMEPEQD